MIGPNDPPVAKNDGAAGNGTEDKTPKKLDLLKGGQESCPPLSVTKAAGAADKTKA